MDLKSLAYTSLASIDISANELQAIHHTALQLNPLDGITGLLVFNGSRFLQILEGTEPAVHDLVERLRRDRRHSGLEIRTEGKIERRSFPNWSMELVKVSAGYFEARETISAHLPLTIDQGVRELLHEMTEGISYSVRIE